MKKKILCFSFLVLTSSFFFTDIKSEIENIIVVKVGKSLITSVDVRNEIITNLLINNQEIIQKNINTNKNFAIKNLINKSIKKNEISKYGIKDYSKKDLELYIESIAKKLSINLKDMPQIFRKNNINYDLFVEKHKIELLWNTLIYQIYNNQINVNIIEVQNDLKKVADEKIVNYNLSEIEISKTEYSKSKYDEILKLIKIEGFESTAKKISQAVSANAGGAIGWVQNKSLSKKYLKQIEVLKVGEISAPVLNNNLVVIFKLNDIKIIENKISFQKIKEKILQQRKEEKLRLFSRSHFSNLENKISIKFQ
jgi:parvulin-like peptidyl-prolyl isomerase